MERVDPPSSEARVPPGAAQPTETQIRFSRALRDGMRREWVTDALIAANVVVMALMAFRGVDLLFPQTSLLEFGANYGPLTRGGQWWRLISSMFLHGGLLHLAFNMYALHIAGRLVERVYGHAGFALLYLFAGLTGSAASTFTSELPSVGASGAVFGVFAAMLGFVMRRRTLLPALVLKRLRFAILATLAINIAFGFSVPGIDNAAHLGGLAGGLLASVLLAPSLDGDRIRRPWWAYVAVAAGCAAVVALVVLA